jgi:hypothetical protein
MKIIAYYDGSDQHELWLKAILPSGVDVEFRKIPARNDTDDFVNLPAYIADILLLDKPDFILSGTVDGVHEKPLFSIEATACTPQYQHALQRFSRVAASVEGKCPSAIVIPQQKLENKNNAKRLYKRSQAIDYGAVKLMDIYKIPAFVFDWPDKNGTLQNWNATDLPDLDCASLRELKKLLAAAIKAFADLDYVTTLLRSPLVRELLERARSAAYRNGPPTIANPGGSGEGGAGGAAKLELISTADLLDKIQAEVPNAKSLLAKLPAFFHKRENSLLFYPSRITKHAGDPYVGMVSYYDIAFCRDGVTPRDRTYNLVAYASKVAIAEVLQTMHKFHQNTCPFAESKISAANIVQYSYHLKSGCRATKTKPVRIYSELADLLVFKDGILLNVG